jgi:hypothetical protein
MLPGPNKLDKPHYPTSILELTHLRWPVVAWCTGGVQQRNYFPLDEFGPEATCILADAIAVVTFFPITT